MRKLKDYISWIERKGCRKKFVRGVGLTERGLTREKEWKVYTRRKNRLAIIKTINIIQGSWGNLGDYIIYIGMV